MEETELKNLDDQELIPKQDNPLFRPEEENTESPEQQDVANQSEEEQPDAAQQQRIESLKGALSLLQLEHPRYLHQLEEARRINNPVTYFIEGYEHNVDTVLALLRCAHAFTITLTFVPVPVKTIADKSPKKSW